MWSMPSDRAQLWQINDQAGTAERGSMTIDEFGQWYGVAMTDEQRLASAFLEGMGLRFCMEYVYENCVSLADAKMAELFEEESFDK